MARLTDPDYLARQYGDARNLNARLRLHQRYSVNRYGWQRWLFDRLVLPAKARLLDLGCGSGELWRENRARIPAGWRVTLADLSAGMLDAARHALAARPGRFALTNADAQDLPFPDDCFDGVLAMHMLYHVPDRPRALREIRRVLRPGGRLYASTVGEQHMAELSRSQLARRFGIDLGTKPAEAHEAAHGAAHGAGTQSGAQSGAADGPAGFTLENGGDQLGYLFNNVRLFLYEDRLEVGNAAGTSRLCRLYGEAGRGSGRAAVAGARAGDRSPRAAENRQVQRCLRGRQAGVSGTLKRAASGRLPFAGRFGSFATSSCSTAGNTRRHTAKRHACYCSQSMRPSRRRRWSRG